MTLPTKAPALKRDITYLALRKQRIALIRERLKEQFSAYNVRMPKCPERHSMERQESRDVSDRPETQRGRREDPAGSHVRFENQEQEADYDTDDEEDLMEMAELRRQEFVRRIPEHQNPEMQIVFMMESAQRRLNHEIMDLIELAQRQIHEGRAQRFPTHTFTDANTNVTANVGMGRRLQKRSVKLFKKVRVKVFRKRDRFIPEGYVALRSELQRMPGRVPDEELRAQENPLPPLPPASTESVTNDRDWVSVEELVRRGYVCANLMRTRGDEEGRTE